MPPRLIFMGTPPFALASLRACLQLGEVVAVVTQPDKPRGRGQEVSFGAVKQLALEQGLNLLQPTKIRGTDFAQQLKTLNADVAVVTAYGKILPLDTLQAPRLGCVNVHASLLPRFRGAAPIQWALAQGDKQTGVCLMEMDEGMDTGPVIACASLPILPDDDSPSLHHKLSALGGELLRANLLAYLRGERLGVPQSCEGVVMAPMIRKGDGELDFTRPAVELERRLRAFTPWPGAFTHFEAGLLKVHALKVGEGTGAAGVVLSLSPQGIEVGCGEGSVIFTTLQPEGRKPMSAQQFLAARKLTVGDRPFGNFNRPRL